MARFLSSRRILSRFLSRPPIVSGCSLCSKAHRSIEKEKDHRAPAMSHKPYLPVSRHPGIQLPGLIPSCSNCWEGFSIDLVDPDLWQVSFGVTQAREGLESQASPSCVEKNEGDHDRIQMVEEFPDFDEIENLRLQKKLFYKLDRGSKEFDENNISFHRKKSSSKKNLEKKGNKKMEKSNAKMLTQKNSKASTQERGRLHADSGTISSWEVSSMETKKKRVPTFNQLTDLYHLPFCLDICITKGSVRACIVHRVTSKVVAVAHSISKDFKFDLTSRKDSVTSAAVGRILAQRAIEDDIHNVIYTPRKGDKIEGKLHIVLQSIIDHGIDVKVKLKQKKPMKRT